MKKITVEECERISISTIVHKQVHHVINLMPDVSLEGLNAIIAQRLDNINYQSIIHGCLLKLSFTTTVPHLGGLRYWFICPYCNRRVGTLYRPRFAVYFKCRHCYNLTYKSTQTHDRRVKSAENLILNMEGYVNYLWRKKPKLFWKIYDKHNLNFPFPYQIRERKEEKAYNEFVKPLLGN